MPSYNINDFIKACDKTPGDVIPIGSVLKDARECFNLKTKRNLLEFIANNGMENLRFYNTKEWEENQEPDNPVNVDAYEFRTLGKLGYIAFFKNFAINKWIIKSFHLSKDRSKAIEEAFKKAGYFNKIKSQNNLKGKSNG